MLHFCIIMSLPEDFKNSNYFALFNSNSSQKGFKNHYLCSNKTSQSLNSHGFIFLNYDLKNKIEKLISKNNSPLNFNGLIFFVPEKEIHFKHLSELNFSASENNSKIDLQAKTSKAEYIEIVSKLKEHIQAGDMYEINYCITFEAFGVKIDPLEIYYKLNKISNAPYSALVKLKDKYIISESPELFLSKRGNSLFTKPIKGTAPRGNTETEDKKNKIELQNNLKERTENVMIVDVARNDLSRVAKKGSVKVGKLYDIETYDQVHQMVSTVSCELKDNVSLDDIIHATFPMASMTGAPKIRAMQLIDQYETNNRGPYSGCIGYIDPNGDFDLSVLIRSIFYNETEKYLSFSVGSAITHLCDPEKEYEECLLKAKAMIEVLSR